VALLPSHFDGARWGELFELTGGNSLAALAIGFALVIHMVARRTK
jgi:hypothetical protein